MYRPGHVPTRVVTKGGGISSRIVRVRSFINGLLNYLGVEVDNTLVLNVVWKSTWRSLGVPEYLGIRSRSTRVLLPTFRVRRVLREGQWEQRDRINNAAGGWGQVRVSRDQT